MLGATLLRAAFEQTLAELEPMPEDSEALYVAIAEAWRSGNDRPAYVRARDLLDAKSEWPQYSRRLTELAPFKLLPIHELFVWRVIMMAQASRRRVEALEVLKSRPHWEFLTVCNPRVPAECARMHGAIRPGGAGCFADGPPCWRPDCSCRISTLSDFALKTRVSK